MLEADQRGLMAQTTVIPTTSRKIETNSYLPRLAEGYVRQELGLDDLVAFFETYHQRHTRRARYRRSPAKHRVC